MSYDQYLKLFQSELQVVNTALRRACGNEPAEELLPHYRQLLTNYEKLLKATNKIYKISDWQSTMLIKQEEELKTLLRNCSQGFLTFGRDLKINKNYSTECERIFSKRIAGLNVATLLSQDDAALCQRMTELFQAAFESGPGAVCPILEQLPRIAKIGGRDIRLVCKPINSVDNPQLMLMLILTDITEEIKAQTQLEYLSYNDPVTRLYNRAYAEKILREIDTPQNQPVSLIMADMNGLKVVNDVFGHAQGDRFIVGIANILRNTCRSTDIIARWGGDEFLVIMPNTDNDTCRKISLRIKNQCDLSEPNPIPFSLAIGIATKDKVPVALNELFDEAETQMYHQKLIEEKENRNQTAQSLLMRFYTQHYEDTGHVSRAKVMIAAFAEYMDIERRSAEMRDLLRLAELHDIGKVAIPKKLLAHTGPLDPKDWKIIQSHSEVGYRAARSLGESQIADAILTLRERWDGSGYPFGWAGEQIPLSARMFAIVEAYDVMTNNRPYRKAMPREQAIQEIRSHAGSQFDPLLAEVFTQVIEERF